MLSLTFESVRSRLTLKSHQLLLVASLAVLIGPSARAQVPAQEVEEVVVTDTRSVQSNVTIPASIDVISRAEIKASGAVHIAEVLRGRGGVQITDNSGDGSRVSVGMRGFGETANANTLILVDGRRLNNPDIGTPDLNSISLRDVERIEIIQGSAGTLYGDQAVGGVINIITRKVGPLKVELDASTGSYDRRGLQGSASQRFDNGLSYRLSGEVRDADNYRQHNEIHYRSVFANLAFDHASGAVFGELQLVDENLNTAGPLLAAEVAANRRQTTTNFLGDFSNTDTSVVRFGVQQSLNDNWAFESELTNRESEARFRLSSVFAPELAVSPQNRHVLGFTPRLVGAYPTSRGDLLFTFGYDLEFSDYDITSRFGTQLNKQTLRGLYGQAVIPVTPKVSVTVGKRSAEVENDLRDSGAFALFPAGIAVDDVALVTEAGLTVRPTADWRLFLRRDENLRFAKVDEHLSPAGGVPLKTQTGTSWELGAEWNHGGHAVKALVYRLELDDEIGFDPATFKNLNFGDTRRTGLILDGLLRVSERVSLSANYSFLDAEVESGTFKGKDVPYVARHLFRASVDYLSFYAELQAIGERVFSGDFTNVLGKLDGYTVTNLRTSYRRGPWAAGVRLNNVLNEKYSEFGARTLDPVSFAAAPSFLPSPERNAWLTLGYAFD